MLGEEMVQQIRGRAPAAVCIGLSDVFNDGERRLHTDLMGVMHMCCRSTSSLTRVDLVHFSLDLPLLPQSMQRLVRAVDECRDRVQRRGCLTRSAA
jgi:hypothetical protein